MSHEGGPRKRVRRPAGKEVSLATYGSEGELPYVKMWYLGLEDFDTYARYHSCLARIPYQLGITTTYNIQLVLTYGTS